MDKDSPFVLYHNGKIYTADKSDSVHDAMAVKDGRVLAVGTDEAVTGLCGGAAERKDLGGNTVIPGLVDAHLHPFWGGVTLTGRSLGYRELPVPKILARLRGFLEEEAQLCSWDQWLLVTCWYRSVGDDPTRDLLDALPTKRPIVIFSDDCHFAALNSAAMGRLSISKGGTEPKDGWIRLDPQKELNGILEDGPAMRAFDQVMRLLGRADHYGFMRNAFRALAAQGVTTIMDARGTREYLELASSLEGSGELPLRYVCAVEPRGNGYRGPGDAKGSVANCAKLRDNFDSGDWEPRPSISVGHLKFFVDGMPSTQTAFMLEPYNVNRGTESSPDWVPGDWRGKPYFEPGELEALVLEGADRGFHPHFHVIADGAAQISLDAVRAMRGRHPGADLRPALAHLDLVAPSQYKEMVELGAFAVLSFQWAGQDSGLIKSQLGIYGPERFRGLETHARFLDHGVKVAYGSDWPVEPLDEWGNFQVGMTRRLLPDPAGQRPRLDNDRDLTMLEILRAATITAATSLGKESLVGSLEKGKFADFAVVEGDLLARDKESVRETRVLRTVVGGMTVYEAQNPK